MNNIGKKEEEEEAVPVGYTQVSSTLRASESSRHEPAVAYTDAWCNALLTVDLGQLTL